jgi:hypothetical protein
LVAAVCEYTHRVRLSDRWRSWDSCASLKN